MEFDQRLKLILSADLIGSTSLKQRFNEVEDGHGSQFDWPKKIQDFYSSFDRAVVSVIDSIDEQCVVHRKSEARSSSEKAQITIDDGRAMRRNLLGPRPVFWKTVGDEVLYWKIIESPFQLLVTLSYWLRVIDEVRRDLNPHSNQQSLYRTPSGFLDVKSTAWLASFPIRNRVTFKYDDRPWYTSSDGDKIAKIAEEDKGRDLPSLLTQLYSLDDEPSDDQDDLQKQRQEKVPHYDFIGPSIDTGFRIAAFSDSKKMSIDVSIVYMLSRIFSDHANFVDGADSKDPEAVKLKRKDVENVCRAIFPDSTGYSSGTLAERLRVFYSGSEPLKGVAGGNPYPKFWINAAYENSYEQLKEKATWSKIRQASSWKELASFSEVYFDHRRKYALRPFLNNDEHFSVPEEYPVLEEKFLKDWRGEDASTEPASPPLSHPTT